MCLRGRRGAASWVRPQPTAGRLADRAELARAARHSDGGALGDGSRLVRDPSADTIVLAAGEA